MLLNFDSVRRRNRFPGLMTPVRPGPPGALVIGLVNNMPLAAAQSTEWQFSRLLEAASGSRSVVLRCFVPPALREAAGEWNFVGPQHHELDALWDADVDGLIVTGTEPRAGDICDEPIWPMLANLVDWAADHTVSTIWSCLAAHAAVMRLDDLTRYPLPAKMSGLFECGRTADHPLVRDMPARWMVPHSRCNDLDEVSLIEQGYSIVSKVPGGGADCFTKSVGTSTFVMMQGHPEYDADCLLREYRRDVKRFLAGRRPLYPLVPANYFDAATELALGELRELAMRRPEARLLGDLDAIVDGSSQVSWAPAAVKLYAGWLAMIAAGKATQHAAPARRASGLPVHP